MKYWGLIIAEIILIAMISSLYYITKDDYNIVLDLPLAKERVSPFNHIKQDQIKVYDDKIIIEIPNARWSNLADTGSMDPLLDEGANTLEKIPQTDPEQTCPYNPSHCGFQRLVLKHKIGKKAGISKKKRTSCNQNNPLK